MGRALWQRRSGESNGSNGSGLLDAGATRDALADAEAALRAGDTSAAEGIYLGILAEPDAPGGDDDVDRPTGTDQRTRSQCHARLAALALDQRNLERSLRETAEAAAARRKAIADDRCTADDIRFMITALVHAATVHERVGAHDEAITSCRVALDFADYAQTQDHDPRTRQSLASARRAVTRLLDELTTNRFDPTDDRTDASDSPAVETDEATAPAAPVLVAVDDTVIDLTDSPTARDTDDDQVIDLRDGADDDLEDLDDLGDDLYLPGNGRFELHTDRHRERQAARRAEREAQRRADPSRTSPDRRQPGNVLEPAATLLARARADAELARTLFREGDDAASINAHRAVRTATRARPWAKHDEQAAAQVALTLVDALVTRSDVLSGTGTDEGGGTDLRRARAIAEHLWRACPSANSAAACILASTRSTVYEWDRGDTTAAAVHLEQAVQIMGEADALGIEMSDALTTFESPEEATSDRDELVAFGDQVFTALELERSDVVLATT